MCSGDGGAAHGHGEGEDADLRSPLLRGGAVRQVPVNMGHLWWINTNIIDTRVTLASEGVRRGFYAGTSPALVAYVSENSVLFTALGQTQKLVARVRGKQKYSHEAILSSSLQAKRRLRISV